MFNFIFFASFSVFNNIPWTKVQDVFNDKQKLKWYVIPHIT